MQLQPSEVGIGPGGMGRGSKKEADRTAKGAPAVAARVKKEAERTAKGAPLKAARVTKEAERTAKGGTRSGGKGSSLLDVIRGSGQARRMQSD